MECPKLFSSKLLSLAAIFAAVMLVLPGIARAEDAAAVGEAASATVKAIDPAARTVTLETAAGESRTITCGKEVINFDQIKVGDQVKAVAVGEVAVALGKPGAPSDEDAAIIARAGKGDKPGAIIAKTVEMSVKIDNIDAATRMVTLTGPGGKSKTIEVSPDVDLSKVNKGDEITLRVTKGVALWVEPAGGAQPAAGRINPGGAEMREVATVEAVDPAARTVTLKTAKGESKTIRLGKEAVNFNQIKPGDKVKATLAEEVAIAVSKGGAPPSVAEESAVILAPKGAKPGMIIADSEQVTGKIQSIDADKRMITLALPDGTTKMVKAGQRVNLADLKAGDDITARVSSALAIVVEKP